MIKVSVIMITYNHDIYISEAIQGILMQLCDFEIEVIIADDKSPDNTEKVVMSIIKSHPKGHLIKYTKHKVNKGMHENFVWASEQCKGKYIALCEGDDKWIDPLKLQQQVSFLDQNPDYSMCIHNATVNNLINGTTRKFNEDLLKTTFLTKDVIMKSWFTPTASFLYRNYNFTMPKWKNVNGDMIILYLNSLYGKIHYINKEMSVYNYGVENSLSQVLSLKNKRSRFLALYAKKFNLLNEFDKLTGFKYFFYTMKKRLAMCIGIVFNMMK